MERDKDYDNAFHYLEILLQVRGGGFQLCWLVVGVLEGRRAVPDEISGSPGGAVVLAPARFGGFKGETCRR